MGSVSSFKESVSGKKSTVLLSILSRLSLSGIHGLTGDRILAIAGKPYYSQFARNGLKSEQRTSATAKKFLAELVATGFAEKLDRSPFATDRDHIPKLAITDKGRSKLVKLKEEFNKRSVK